MAVLFVYFANKFVLDFLILTFFGSYQTMWGLHYLIVGDIWVAFLGSLRFLLGLFVCFLSNYYLNHNNMYCRKCGKKFQKIVFTVNFVEIV